jgi:outer membrane protein OmpA-like peptidoglycan-associated protein
MTRQLLITALFVAGAVTCAVTQTAWAAPQEEMLYYRDGVRIDPVEVQRILAGPALKRSIRLLPEASTDEPPTAVTLSAKTHSGGGGGAGVAKASPVATASVELAPMRSQPESIALPVQFAFDSADILPRARTQLDAVAQGIKLLPPSHSVLIEGHTDALGTPQYNLQLSRSRAEAVKRYLVTEHGLDAQRLKTIGFGEGRPLDGEDASKPENRRVQFRGA